VPTWLPTRLLVGEVDASAYLAATVRAAPALAEASSRAPEGAPVAYVGMDEGAQIYTDALLVYPDPASLGDDPELIAGALQDLGTSLLIWDRGMTRRSDMRATVLSTAFLGAHGRPLAAGQDGYLFEIDPRPANRWALEGTNILADPDLTLPGADGSWIPTGAVEPSPHGVRIGGGAIVAQAIGIGQAREATLLADVACDGHGRAELRFRWQDGAGATLGTDTDIVDPDAGGPTQFMWRPVPAGAAGLVVELGAAPGSSCDYSRAVLHVAR